MTFVDTSAWVAIFVDGDPHNEPAGRHWDHLRESGERLATTFDVIDETFTVIERRRDRAAAIRAGEFILGSAVVTRLPITAELFDAAWDLYRSPEHDGLSFTDCTSVAAMRAAGAAAIFTFDRGFRKASLPIRP